jgi:alanine-alpha-ketoisovalerate/valine-pyruvate aminotransferase
LSGDAQKYSQQVKERIKNIENSKGKNLLVAPLDKMPYSICVGDIEPDSIHWTNQAVAGYFNLASIKIDSSLSSK